MKVVYGPPKMTSRWAVIDSRMTPRRIQPARSPPRMEKKPRAACARTRRIRSHAPRTAPTSLGNPPPDQRERPSIPLMGRWLHVAPEAAALLPASHLAQMHSDASNDDNVCVACGVLIDGPSAELVVLEDARM